MTVTVVGGPVEEWVQAFADKLDEVFPKGIHHISTYEGHDPTRVLALDVFPMNQTSGDWIASWAINQYTEFGIDYHIWWQRIYNPEILMDWRPMADRGSITQNHKDHVHFSFLGDFDYKKAEDDMADPQVIALLQDINSKLDKMVNALTVDDPWGGGIKGTVKAISNTFDQVADKLSKQ